MKFKQMEYALVVARTRSFSAAAKELYVSQPNISASITALENDLGYQIFERTNKGIELTRDGVVFLRHANNIMSELDDIQKVSKGEEYINLSIGNMFTHTAVNKAFLKLCNKYMDKENINLSIYEVPLKEVIKDVYLNKIQIGIIYISSVMLESYINSFQKKNLKFQVIREIPLNVNIRKDHPVMNKEDFDLLDLHDYPIVHYASDLGTSVTSLASNLERISEFPDIFSMGFINLNKTIFIDNKDIRREIILSTDAYSIGANYHPAMTDIEKIISIPIPDLKMSLGLVYKENQPNGREFYDFIDFFTEEIDSLVVT